MRLQEVEILYARPDVESASNKGEVKVGLLGSMRQSNGWCSTGACYDAVMKMDKKESTYFLFNLAIHLIVRDKIDPIVVHNAFCEIDEYRDGLAYDSPVPDQLKGLFKKEVEERPDCFIRW